MEEKLKAPDSASGENEVGLFRRCQDLETLVQEKDETISLLEQQLEEQVNLVFISRTPSLTCTRPLTPC